MGEESGEESRTEANRIEKAEEECARRRGRAVGTTKSRTKKNRNERCGEGEVVWKDERSRVQKEGRQREREKCKSMEGCEGRMEKNE